MTKNIIYSASGAALGLLLGFFIANSIAQKPASPAVTATPAGSARPLGPDDANAELPPNHPDIGEASAGGQTGGSSSAAATSAAAQAAMDKADRAPEDFDAQMEAGKVFYNLDDFAKAELYFDRAISLRPKDAEALTWMGNAKYDARDYVAAATFYERSLAVNPNDPNVRTDLGLTYFLRQPPDPARAIAEYRKSLDLDPKHEKSWQNMAAAAIYMRDKRTAVAALDGLAKANPQNDALASLRRDAEALP